MSSAHRNSIQSQLWRKNFHYSRQHLKCFVPNAMRRYSRYLSPMRQYFHGDKAPSALVLPLHPSSSLQVSKVAAQPNLEPRHPSEGEHPLASASNTSASAALYDETTGYPQHQGPSVDPVLAPDSPSAITHDRECDPVVARQQQQPRSILRIRSSVTVLGEGSTSHKRPPPLDRTSTVPPLLTPKTHKPGKRGCTTQG
ncbi:hypothetical protein CSOJ01_06544 [Colletotrichum sojae]|uniref:Uncharacterized protein n=1 Tax=Colletotrichum sojae TaxID=2175907 RepID=A0A8H6JCD4_9PEZI|nr:hypothetical protein CSOJ01_06544 [Colletotrichum sojae]